MGKVLYILQLGKIVRLKQENELHFVIAVEDRSLHYEPVSKLKPVGLVTRNTDDGIFNKRCGYGNVFECDRSLGKGVHLSLKLVLVQVEALLWIINFGDERDAPGAETHAEEVIVDFPAFPKLSFCFGIFQNFFKLGVILV